ncbi:HEAT repeat domain-containing protein [Clostridium fermenticellae]|uniref:HEAT repeat domain-containing protein n=1 Tax=Clostridium fermenticellae TaxID=2068654 RepID=A0A386H6M6_9CLOT|nr:HEAT repeat domain-containing protein [Clostridium fermenticellae]AYD41421.1 HEAT repeat domain-containing protein [Clostridium fermenticellae]
MVDIDWSKIDDYDDDDITYFMFLEGKKVNTLCKIRNLSEDTIKRHILNGKIKYGILAKSNDVHKLFEIMMTTPKQDKIDTLKGLKCEDKNELIEFIRNSYADMSTKAKEIAVWILGEIGNKDVVDILSKASVNNHVNVRRMSISALGKIGDIKSEDILIRALDDSNSQVIMYAVKALLKIKSLKAADKIKEIYNSTDKEYLKLSAQRYLESDLEDKR